MDPNMYYDGWTHRPFTVRNEVRRSVTDAGERTGSQSGEPLVAEHSMGTLMTDQRSNWSGKNQSGGLGGASVAATHSSAVPSQGIVPAPVPTGAGPAVQLPAHP